jgi:hypothetical protein
MSEYQYYEFQAIDRPLSAKEMSELRSYSTRARITVTSFVNHYEWGSFKGDEDLWMEKYFDAFLYLANWGMHVLKLSLPSRLLDATMAKEYCGGGRAFVREKAGKVMLTYVSEDEENGEGEEGESQLSSMISVRAELARGDLRALYLGWLLRAQARELDDEDIEPPVPPGLGQLSASLESFASFLRIEGDLLDAAAETSRPLGDMNLDRNEVRAWVGKLVAKEKDELIVDLLVHTDHAPLLELLQRFLKDRSAEAATGTAPLRSVKQLLQEAETCAKKRKHIEAQMRAEAKVRQEREAAIAREKHLLSLVGREEKLWAKVDALITTTQPKSYDLAVKILVDLRDLDARGKGDGFKLRIRTLRQTHARKPSLIDRLGKAGL